MLVEFTITNFRSILEETTFSMQTAPYLKKFKETNTLLTEPINLLKTSVIFGSNGSGKTNLLNAASTLKGILINFKRNSIKKSSKLPYQPFKMLEHSEKQFTTFEILLLLEGELYKYLLKYNEDYIDTEILTRIGKNNDHSIFIREYDSIEGDYTYILSDEVSDLSDKTRRTAPYLAILAEFNDYLASKIMSWFINDLVILDADFDVSDFEDIYERLEDEQLKEKLLIFLKVADFNIVDIELRKRKQKVPEAFNALMESIFKDQSIKPEKNEYVEIIDLFTVYNKYDNNFNKVGSSFLHADSYESRGTNKMILISLILLDAMENGRTLFIDEFDNAFHLTISRFLLKVFNSKFYNKNSQFILNTHDLSLMDSEILRVDQVWFVEKDKTNSSEFYSLFDFNETNNRARSDMSFAKDYLNGKFGAIPIINESILLDDIFNQKV